MNGKIMTNCHHIPGSGCCKGEMINRSCPLRTGNECVGRTGGIGANLSAAQIMVGSYPEERIKAALPGTPEASYKRRKSDRATA